MFNLALEMYCIVCRFCISLPMSRLSCFMYQKKYQNVSNTIILMRICMFIKGKNCELSLLEGI